MNSIRLNRAKHPGNVNLLNGSEPKMRELNDHFEQEGVKVCVCVCGWIMANLLFPVLLCFPVVYVKDVYFPA